MSETLRLGLEGVHWFVMGNDNEHGLVEASPNVLRQVNKVLDSTHDAVDLGPGRVRVDDELGGFGGGEFFFFFFFIVLVFGP